MVRLFRGAVVCVFCLLLALSMSPVSIFAVDVDEVADEEAGGAPANETCLNKGGDDDNGDEDDDCNGGDDEDEDEDCPEDEPGDESEDCPASLVDPLSGVYFHYGYDYRLRLPGGGGGTGCTTCGAVGANHYGPGTIGKLPGLGITRLHSPRQEKSFSDENRPSYFGRFSTLALAVSMTLEENNPAQGTRALIDIPTSSKQQTQAGDNVGGAGVGDGILGVTASNMEEVRLYDKRWEVNGTNWSNDGVLTSDLTKIQAAEITFRSGKRWLFEVFDRDGSANDRFMVARIVRRENSNGVGLTFGYSHPAPDSGTWPAVGGPLSGVTPGGLWELDTLSDDYGRTAQFTSSLVAGTDRCVIDQIDLPNGEEVEYSYYASGELEDVQHPDGSVSTFGYDVDGNYARHHIYDTSADPDHRRKTLYVSRPQWNGTNTYENRVIKIRNGEGELVYATWERDRLNQNESTVYAYRGGNLLERYEQSFSQIVNKEFATSVAEATGGGLDLVNTTWEQESSFGSRSQRMTGSETDGLGRQKTFTRDTARRVYTGSTFPDQSSTSRVYHSTYNWVMESTDRLGRKTVYTRDDTTGNPLTKTVAGGSGVEATETWTYNGLGQCETYEDANGNLTEYFYSTTGDPANIDGEGYLVKVIEPADVVGGPRAEMLYTYDVVNGGGRLMKSQDALGREAIYTYDARQRLTAVTYEDTSQDQWVYGAPGSGDENIVVETIDRNGNIEKCEFDAADREILCTTAFGTDEAVTTTTTYLTGMAKVLTRTVHGETTTYGYDGKNRVVSTTKQVNGGQTLTSTTAYDAGQRRRSTTDPYGRRTFTAYDINDRVARMVTETVPGSVTLPGVDSTPAGALANDTHLLGLVRTADDITGANAGYLIQDYTYDSEGQLTEATDPRGFATKHEYDEQGRRFRTIEAFGTSVAATTETVYDLYGNVTEVRSPRYFDATDTNGYQNARTTMTYTGRNLLASRTAAPGTPDEATESYTYFLDKREDTQTDARGNAFAKLWGICCARIMATIDPPADVDGSGTLKRAATITRHDFYGNLTHSGRVVNVDNVDFANTTSNPTVLTDLPDSETLQEVTTRYDARHRPVATTTWLVPLPGVDPDNVPIAGGGLTGDPAVEDTNGVLQGLEHYQSIRSVYPQCR